MNSPTISRSYSWSSSIRTTANKIAASGMRDSETLTDPMEDNYSPGSLVQERIRRVICGVKSVRYIYMHREPDSGFRI